MGSDFKSCHITMESFIHEVRVRVTWISLSTMSRDIINVKCVCVCFFWDLCCKCESYAVGGAVLMGFMHSMEGPESQSRNGPKYYIATVNSCFTLANSRNYAQYNLFTIIQNNYWHIKCASYTDTIQDISWHLTFVHLPLHGQKLSQNSDIWIGKQFIPSMPLDTHGLVLRPTSWHRSCSRLSLSRLVMFRQCLGIIYI